MTRIRPHKKAFSYACFLLLSCLLPLVMAADFESLLDVYGESRPQSLYSSRVRSSGRRRAQDDKNNDKNNDKDATTSPFPSFSPTQTPVAAPSPSPTIKETLTAYPTITPWPTITPYPTKSPWPTITPYPTVAPTFTLVENSVGNLVMEMSVSDPTVTAADVNEGRANTLLDGVLAGMLEVLCRIHYIMVQDNQNVEGTKACPESFSKRMLQTLSESSKEDFPVVWTMSRVSVEDYQDEKGDDLTYWTVVFPVLDIGQAYTNWAIGQGADASDQAAINATALNGMYEDSYYALQKYIQRGNMDEQLPDTATAVADPQEVPAPAPGAFPAEQLDPAPLHPMRVAGMILLIATLVSTFLLVKLSARRKKEREEDSAIAKDNMGGLVTEEGLDFMLDVGRRESEKVGLTTTEVEVVLTASGQEAEENASEGFTREDEEKNQMLPMPGYLNNTMSTNAPPRVESIDSPREGAVLEAAKASAADDANKTYSFLTIFGSHDEDSEPEDAVLPHEAESHEEPASHAMAGFMNMFSMSTEDSQEKPGADASPAPGSMAGGDSDKSSNADDTVNL